MRKYLPVLVLFFLSGGCTKEDISIKGLELAKSACGNDMAWLSELIGKAREDKASKKYSGAYFGTIHMGSYKDKPVFVVQMMYTAGRAYIAYNCDHQETVVAFGDLSDFVHKTTTSGQLIYSSHQ